MLSRLGVTLLAAATFAFGCVAPSADAHDISTPAGHAAEDAVVLTAAQERVLNNTTRALTRGQAWAAAAAVTGGPQDVGQWGPVVNWPVVAINAALLSNGKVLAYDSIGDNATETYPIQDHTRATIWDPATGSQTPVDLNTGYNIFCSGFAHLIDGRIFIAGGNKDQQLNGIPQTHIFDPATDLWTVGPTMLGGRWYPTVTPLSNGEMLITSGRVDTPEVRTLNGNLRALTSASLSLPLYPWMDVAPSGLTLYSGPDQTLRALNTAGTGAWQTLGTRDSINRDYGGHAIYDIGKMLVAGGGPSTTDARVIDFNGVTPQVSATAPMANGRRQFNLTVLADGSVLATGGNSSGAGLVDLNAGVYPAEQWNPATGQWKTLASMQITRQYHSTALLLPDGRVLSAGGGICGTCDAVGYLAKNAEIFSPPYLFQADGTLAPRPTIDSAPSTTSYGASMTIATGNPASIRKVALVRLGAVTHSDNMEQRYIPLSYTAGATTLTATAPASANIAPPGYYMLFIIDANGVPSVASMVSVQPANSPPTVTLTQPTDGQTFTAPATVNLAATASDSDGTVTKVEFFNGAAKLGEDTTAPYTFSWSPVSAGTYTLTARATDDDGAATTSAQSTITVSATNAPPTVNITSPANGAIFAWKPTISITATASDPDGNVTKVQFFDGTTLLAQDTSAPYVFTWRNVSQGSHSLTAQATDNVGAVTTSSAVGITVRPKRG
ncbi:MAG TPA: Ig-like domain-containing protein [Gaiellaceae bacterium]|nr:Ig-like domain-containing protein [Gaiellaceae bacterium]